MKFLINTCHLLILFSLLSCNKSISKIDQVNVFIGTSAHGHTFPGSTIPFGMVQLSPDTRIEGWDGCSGYHYSDSIIYGFSHTHLSGTGIGDYCDLLLMPTQGDICFDNGYKSKSKFNYSSTFKKENETAKPGIYNVVLDKYGINCSLTSTNRVGIHQYEFSDTSISPALILDLEHRDQLLDWELNLNSENEISGKRISRSWAEEQHFYFYMQLSGDVEVTFNNEIRPTKAFIEFNEIRNSKVMVKVGVSTVSIANAKENLIHEAKTWNFNQYVKLAQDKWEKELSKIDVKTSNNVQKEIFYTSLYHSMIAPNTLSDVNGQYRGTDLKIHESNQTIYTVFSLWDTFRSTHPLYNIINREKSASFLNTFLRQYEDGGQLPIWELCSNYTGCMIGYHVVSVILDAYVKGVESPFYYDLFQAMKAVSNRNELGIPTFKEKGYISAFIEAESVSKTLEYAYNDWCIAEMANIFNDTNCANEYYQRAQYYKNIFNNQSGFMQPKTNGDWKKGFIPSEVNYNYTEANSWQYSFFVPHDVTGLVGVHKGKDLFEKRLDQLFKVDSKLAGRQQADITGMIGQYAHGNEPSHHMAYLYNMIGKPFKSQKMVREIINQMYSNKPEGISGNEDCGQMSAWYVLSAIGLYDLNPGDEYYIIQTPLFDEVKLKLENGKNFTIKTIGDQNSDAIYIKSISLNGKELDRNYLSIKEINGGGEMIIEKSVQLNLQWPNEYYKTSIDSKFEIVLNPRIIAGSLTFKDSILVDIQCDNCHAINYRSSKSVFKKFTKPFYIHNSDSIFAYAEKRGVKSKIESASYIRQEHQFSINLLSSYSNQYNAGGDKALIDGLKGPNNYLTGLWQGFYGNDFGAIIDLKKEMDIRSLSIGAIQDVKSWIWLPKKVDFYSSVDGLNYKLLNSLTHNVSDSTNESVIYQFKHQMNHTEKARYIKIEAANYGPCPEWHLGKGGTSWLFFDEISID